MQYWNNETLHFEAALSLYEILNKEKVFHLSKINNCITDR